IYPTLVQGNEAKHQIVKAIETATGRNECDILLIARGGGSYEDLWCFNEEIVARAIAACSIPIITGIGHEIDITIADFVADLRAATPSQAAQFATPDQNELITMVSNYSKELEHKIKNLLKRYALELESQAKQLQHPLQKIHNWSQMLDNSEANLHHNWHSLMQKKLATLTTLMAKIEALSPMQTLQRGYSIASSKSKIINSIANIKPGDKFDLKVKDGIIKNIVESIIPQEEQVHE
ncbi:MAG: exodeoxyribonuclease VII large subunit, partial [Legionellales bacterium]|nr:exodeoxyribonuclease VII large subunit [Legionellales bacterium]